MAAPEWPDERDDLRALFRKHVEERMPLPHAPDGLAHKFLSVTKIGLGLYLASYVVLPFILLAQAAVFGSFVFVYLWWMLGQLGSPPITIENEDRSRSKKVSIGNFHPPNRPA